MVYSKLSPRHHMTLKQLIGDNVMSVFLDQYASDADEDNYSIEGINLIKVPKNFF